MDFLYIKAIHIVFVVCWFAALFYIVRLFIYTIDAQKNEEPARGVLTKQLTMMQKKLWYIIGWPSMIGTIIFGSWMLYLNPDYYFSQPWMWIKLCFVVVLVFYHLQCERILRRQKVGVFAKASLRLRMFNELATVFLVAIVFLAVVKSTSSFMWGVVGLISFAAVLMVAVMIYRRKSRKSEEKSSEPRP